MTWSSIRPTRILKFRTRESSDTDMTGSAADVLHRPGRLRYAQLGRDDGSLTPMVVVFATAIFLMIGLSVDGGGRMRTIERADSIAAEAARAGGQAINIPEAVTGQADVVDPAKAVAAAKTYLATAGATGTVTVSPDGHQIAVTVHLTYRPVFLGALGFGSWTEEGTATAQLLTG